MCAKVARYAASIDATARYGAEADGDYPFGMVAAPARQLLNSTFSQVPESQRRELRPSLLSHPTMRLD